MTEFTEKRYSIDPGPGKKMDGCPYSAFEDGRDVKDYIIPPKGYVFVGFHFDPEASNQIYDGKLTAEYEKEPINQRLMAHLWKFALAFAVIAVIAVIAILAAGVFKDPKPKPNRPAKETTTVVQPDETETVQTFDTVQNETEAVDTTDVTQVQPTEAEPTGNQEEVSQQPADDPNAKFKQEFWTLIHQRTIMMDPYHELFTNYKGQVEGEEFDYLRYTILKDYNSFKVWYGKLHKISLAELEKINTIDDLKNKLKTIE